MVSEPGVLVPRSAEGASVVRHYINEVLRVSYDFSEESACQSAREWTAGSGDDFRNMRLSQYRMTFGNQVARILYKEVKTRVLEEEYAENPPPTREVRGRLDCYRSFNYLDQQKANPLAHRCLDCCDTDCRKHYYTSLLCCASDACWVCNHRLLGIGALHSHPLIQACIVQTSFSTRGG